MYIIIVGAGDTGNRLTEIALGDGHNVTLIEADQAHAEAAAERYDALVLNAGIADGNIIEESSMGKADAVVAATEDDSANLMAMLISLELEVPTRISVVNNHRHVNMFHRLGARVIEDPDLIVAQHLYRLVRSPEVEEIITLTDGSEIFDVEIEEGSALAGHTFKDLLEGNHLPDGMTLVALYRNEELTFPPDEDACAKGDRLRIFSIDAVQAGELGVFKG